MKKLRKGVLAILLAFCLVFVTACGEAGEESVDEVSQEQTGIKIGLSFDSFIIERWRNGAVNMKTDSLLKSIIWSA